MGGCRVRTMAWCVVCSTLGPAACADPDATMVGETDDGTTTPIPAGDGSSSSTTDDGTTSTGAPGSTSGDPSTTTDPTTGASQTDSGEIEPPPATGIQIVHVTADQGVRVPIAADGALVGPTDRNLPLLQGRPALLRAFYELDPDFADRDIYAELTVVQTDGTTEIYGSFETAVHKDCTGQAEIDCRYATIPSSFFWKIPGELMRPGVTYSIEMLETSPGHEDVVSDKIPVFPTTGGTVPIGVEDSYMKMRVVLVPVDHDLSPDCPPPPDLNEDYGTTAEGEPRTVADFFGERLLAQNPADEVEIIVHDVVTWTGNLTGSSLLGGLQQLRFDDNAPPEHYYYAVARPCDGGPDFAGVAQLGGPDPSEASSRVGWGVYYASVGITANTFVHEIGHEQGRRHIACSGQEAGVDNAYPDHPEGDLMSWGIDVIGNTLEVHTPNGHDYMTYCGNSWVSEWGYDLVLPWIAEISSWDFRALPPQQDLLVGNVRADGTQQWYVARGWLPTARVSPDARVRFAVGGERTEVVAARARWERSDDINVIAPLPENFDAATEVTWIDGELEVPVDRATIVAQVRGIPDDASDCDGCARTPHGAVLPALGAQSGAAGARADALEGTAPDPRRR